MEPKIEFIETLQNRGFWLVKVSRHLPEVGLSVWCRSSGAALVLGPHEIRKVR